VLGQRRSGYQAVPALTSSSHAAIRTFRWAVARRERLPGSATEGFELGVHEAPNQVIRQRFVDREVERAFGALITGEAVA
jgi:hypothetical protein